MVKLLRLLVAATLLTATGCAHNYYNIPRESYEKKVRNLAVAPIFYDAGSDIRLPEKDELATVVKDFNRKNEKPFVNALKESGAYFSVLFLEGDVDKQFDALFFRRERRDDAGVVYNKYFWKQQELQSLLKQTGADAVMTMVVSGITDREKIYSSNLLKYLDADYNKLILTAQILDADGTVLWEYPNFRKNNPSFDTLYRLQYPDFDEAEANLDDQVAIKFKTIAGIRRGFERKSKDILFRERELSKPYDPIFDEILGMLQPPKDWFGIFGSKKNEKKQEPQK